MNNAITWNHIYFKKATECIQGNTIKNNSGFLIWNDGEVVFLTSLKDNFGNPTLNIFELEEITSLAKKYMENKI